MALAKLSGVENSLGSWVWSWPWNPTFDLVLFGHRVNSRHAGNGRRRGDDLQAHGFGHFESALDLFVAEVVAEAVIVGVEIDARRVEFLANRGEFVQGNGLAPIAQLLGFHSFRLDVALPELAFTQADFGHGLDRVIERPVAETVGLAAKLNSVHHGIYFGVAPDRQRRRGRRTSENFLEVSPTNQHRGNHGVEFTTRTLSPDAQEALLLDSRRRRSLRALALYQSQHHDRTTEPLCATARFRSSLSA